MRGEWSLGLWEKCNTSLASIDLAVIRNVKEEQTNAYVHPVGSLFFSKNIIQLRMRLDQT